MLQTIAVVADVHSNHFALEAILADLRQRGADWVVNLGDNLNGPLEPQRCADLLRARCQGSIVKREERRRNRGRRAVGFGPIRTRAHRRGGASVA